MNFNLSQPMPAFTVARVAVHGVAADAADVDDRLAERSFAEDAELVRACLRHLSLDRVDVDRDVEAAAGFAHRATSPCPTVLSFSRRWPAGARSSTG